MLKYKVVKKINLSILKILFCSYSFSCFAENINIEQQQNYISNSINAFFKTKTDGSTKTVNHIFSPYGLNGCLATFSKTQCTDSIAKNKLDNKLIELGLNPNFQLSSVKESKLQMLTAVLTQGAVTQNGHDKLNSENVFLGEYLLQQNNDNIKNQRQIFKEKIQNAMAEKFNDNLNLDYKDFWSPSTSPETYLKVVSAITFQDKWRGEPFNEIGLDTFYTKDNKEIQTEFIEKTIAGSPVKDETSDWQAVRIFYKQKYAIDIILPAKNKQITDENKKHVIHSLISKLNQNKVNYQQNTIIEMPKFECKQEKQLDNYIEEILADITPDYRGFLINHEHKNLLSVSQEYYIKIDNKGTTAEVITCMDAADGGARRATKFLVNRSYFFVLSEYQYIQSRNIPFEIKNIIMIGEVGNPSEQLVTTK